MAQSVQLQGYSVDNRNSISGKGTYCPLRHRNHFRSRAPVRWVPGSYPQGQAAATWNWPLSSICWWSREYIELYLSSPIRLHGVLHVENSTFSIHFSRLKRYFNDDYGFAFARTSNITCFNFESRLIMSFILYSTLCLRGFSTWLYVCIAGVARKMLYTRTVRLVFHNHDKA
jgi:hypothetical protein